MKKFKKMKSIMCAIMLLAVFTISGCGDSSGGKVAGANPDVIEGTWESVEVAVDGSVFTFEELDSMGNTYIEETTIIFKEGGKAVVIIPETNYSTIYDWEKNGEGKWKMSGNWEEFEFVKEEDRLIMEYEDYDTEIFLYFEKTTDDQTVPSTSEEESEESNAKTEISTERSSSENIADTSDFYAAMDEYEIFFDEYIDFMKEYNDSNHASEYMDDYVDYMNQYTETVEALSSIDTDSLTRDELAYYTEVHARIMKKISESGL